MYTIGQVSELFQLPVSTLRYYDKEGLFPEIKRSGGIRYFDTTELEALRLVECLKKTEIGRASCRKECRSRWSPYH